MNQAKNPNPYSLFLDDTRRIDPTDPGNWVLCRTVDCMLETMRLQGAPHKISFDYQLDNTDPGHNGLSALKAFLDALRSAAPIAHCIELRFHSSSPQGGNAMREHFLGERGSLKEAGIQIELFNTLEQSNRLLDGSK